MSDLMRIPALFVQNRGESSAKIALTLTSARESVVVRITGGCGFMDDDDAHGLIELYTQAFRSFEGAMLFGGTRMLRRPNFAEILPGITEVAPAIRKQNPNSRVLGVIPRTNDLGLHPSGLLISDEKENDYLTIVHPEQDSALVVQQSVDLGVDTEKEKPEVKETGSIWDAEFQECMRITERLRTYADWKSLTIAYNGGGVTEKEVRATADKGWPILLIRGSGRKTDELINDVEFRRKYAQFVHVCDADLDSFRGSLEGLGVVPKLEHSTTLRIRNFA
jgi:hypothetical protein